MRNHRISKDLTTNILVFVLALRGVGISRNSWVLMKCILFCSITLFNRSAHSAGPRKKEGRHGSLVVGIWGHLGAILGSFRGIFEPSWGHLGASWGHLGPSWGYLGPSWGHLGHILGILSHLRAILALSLCLVSWALLYMPPCGRHNQPLRAM